MDALRAFALKLPDTDEGVACEGTRLERRTIRSRGKAFVFLGVCEVMLELGESLPEAQKLAADDPATWRVGKSGWLTAKFADAKPPLALLKRWIEESNRVVVEATPEKKKTPKKAVAKGSATQKPAKKKRL